MDTLNTQAMRLDSLMNANGFMDSPEAWTRDIAAAIAREAGLPELTDEHWKIITALRDHYQQFGAAIPAFRHICHEHHLGKHCVERLFNSDRVAWRIAGLPDPGEEARAYM